MEDLTLVTGATGFIGSHLTRQLLDRGEAVRVLVRSPGKLARVARRLVVEGQLPIVFVYPCFCYGPGDVYRSSSKIIDLHLQGLLVASFPGGQNAMDVRDAATGLMAGMDRGAVGERYLVGGTNVSYAELGRALARITGKRPPRLAA